MSVSLKWPQQTARRGHDSPERGGQASDWPAVRPRGWKTCKRMPAAESRSPGNGVSNSSTPILSFQMYAEWLVVHASWTGLGTGVVDGDVFSASRGAGVVEVDHG